MRGLCCLFVHICHWFVSMRVRRLLSVVNMMLVSCDLWLVGCGRLDLDILQMLRMNWRRVLIDHFIAHRWFVRVI